MTRYTKNGEAYNGRFIEVEGIKLLSPSESVLEAAGYHKTVPHQPTEAEVAEMEMVAEIERLKEQLAADEYAPTKAQRQQWRARINELEGEIS